MTGGSVTKPSIQTSLLTIRGMLQRRRVQQAESVARHLQLAYPRRAEANDALATVLAALGDYDQAIPFARKAVEADPRNPSYLLNCGRMLLECFLLPEAESLINRAMANDRKQFLASWTLATFYFRMGLGERALPLYEQAQSNAPPALQAAVRYEHANCLISMGQAKQAEAGLRASQADPAFRPRAIAMLAGLQRNGVDSDAFAAVEAELARTGLSDDDRSKLLTAKGVMLHNSRQYAESFKVLSSAKALLPRDSGLVRRFAEVVGKRISYFTPSLVSEAAAHYGQDTDCHVFVVGMPRSGTTLAEQIIASHSQGAGAGELPLMERIAEQISMAAKPPGLSRGLSQLGRPGVLAVSGVYDSVTRHIAPAATRIVDKMPHNFVRLGEIAMLFPGAKIVHCVRHPADTFISAFQSNMGVAHSYSYTVEDYAQYYQDYRRLMAHWEDVLPGRIFTLEYEALTADPRKVTGALLDYLGMPWEESCLDFSGSRRAINTFSRLQVRQAVNRGSVGRWENYRNEVAPLIQKLGLA